MEVITTSSFPGFVFTWHSGVLASYTLVRRLMHSWKYLYNANTAVHVGAILVGKGLRELTYDVFLFSSQNKCKVFKFAIIVEGGRGGGTTFHCK